MCTVPYCVIGVGPLARSSTCSCPFQKCTGKMREIEADRWRKGRKEEKSVWWVARGQRT